MLGLWASQLPFALVVSAPATELVASTYGRGVDGDAVLWTPGAHALLAFAVQEAAGLRAIGVLAAIAWGAWLFLGLIPLAGVMVVLSHATSDGSIIPRTPTFALASSACTRLWPKFVKLLLGFALADGLLLGSGYGLALAVATRTHRALGEALSQQLALGVGGVFVLAAMALHVVHDLSRGFLVLTGSQEIGAIDGAIRVFRRASLELCLAWAWRAAIALAAVLAGGVLDKAVGGRGGYALVLLALVHQIIVVARASFRTSWLARVLREVAKGISPNSD